MTSSHTSRVGYYASFPEEKQPLVKAIHDAVYNAGIAMSDEQIRHVVEDALIHSRRDLSS